MHTVISARILAETSSSIKRSEEDGTMDTVPLKTTCGGQTEKKKDLISDNLF
jgi:hypothetical protein